MSFYYPPLDTNTVKALSVIRELIIEEPTYFHDSPYGNEVDQLLAKWFQPARAPSMQLAPPPPEVKEEEIDPETGLPRELPLFEGLREEIKQAFLHLKSAKNDKHQDKVAWAKSAVQLLEKLVKLDAASTNIEMVGNFQREMLAILEDVCTPDQREKISIRIQSMISPNVTNLSATLDEVDDEAEGA